MTPDEPNAVYLVWNGETIGLCRRCWDRIADTDVEWGDNPKPENFAQLLESARGLEGAVETEYKPFEKFKSEEPEQEENLDE
jgi:hypothetical protein